MADELSELYHSLAEAARVRMPFGRFGPQAVPPAGLRLCELPFEYLKTFIKKGFPSGRIGDLMALVYRLKLDGAEEVFQQFLKDQLPTSRGKSRQRNWHFNNPD